MGAERRRDEAHTLSKYGSVRQVAPSNRFTPIPSTTPPVTPDCEAIRLPENLESIPKAEHFPTQRHRWNTNEEIAALLISFAKHTEWLSKEVKIRPKSGSMLLYSRKKVRYRRDGYCWKKRKDGKTTREDHMKLKVQGIECIYGCYVHSAILPTFHRRCYWLLQNPDIVLVHYLNVPYPDDNKLVMASSISLWADKKEWTKDELISQLKPMFFSEDEPDSNNELEISTAETVEAIVGQLMEKQRAARVAASKGLVECGCATVGVSGDHAKHCNLHPLRRITIAKLPQQETQLTHHSHTPHRHHHHHQSQQTTSQHHPNSHVHQRHNNHQESTNSVTSSRQTFVALPASSDTDNNQVSSTSGGAPRYQGMNQEGSRRPKPTFTPTPSSPPSPSNNNNNKNDNKSNIENTSKNINLINNNNNNNNTATTPLILNLSNIQGGGGLLIFNSSSSQHQTGAGHHSLTAPFTLTSYFGQPNTIASSGSLQSSTHISRIPTHQILHQNQENLQHHTNQVNQHHLRVAQQQQIIHERNHVIGTQTPVLIKREAKDDIIENLKLDVANGNLTIDSGTFANLVSSLEASENRSKRTSRAEELKESLMSIKAEHLTDLGKDELFSNSLELSSEDIQKTLSANLPSASNHSKSSKSSDDNPMDFIENNMTSAEDDVLANLDAFDMLSDFPDLDHYDTSPPDNLNSNSSTSSSTNVSGKSVANQSQQTLRLDYRENSSNITDYSPEWAYPEGGVKVLVTGPFYSSSSPYTVLFDGVPTSTNLVQAGVLRCYCPAHDVGLVTLQVACEGFIVSNSVIFEYKKPPPYGHHVKEEDLLQEQDEHLLKFTLLQRLETLETRVQPPTDSQDRDTQSSQDDDVFKYRTPNFQEKVVEYCEKLSKRSWLPASNYRSTDLSINISLVKSQTILHIAARLGYSRLIVSLLRWRNENSSLALEWEVDALRKDRRGRTPLSLACLGGHREVAIMLYRWNPQAVNSEDNQGITPLKHAYDNGYTSLEEELSKLEDESQRRTTISFEFSPSSSSPSSNSLKSSSSSCSSTPSLNIIDTSSANTTSDGFLRPSPRRFDLRKQRHLSVDFLLGSEAEFYKKCSVNSPTLTLTDRRGRIVKRPSVDSGINIVSADAFKRASLDSGLDVLQKHYRNCPSSCSINHSLENYLLAPTLIDPTKRNDLNFLHRGSATSELTASDDSRVFTLAEQIIAAIPERIKGEEEDVTELLSPCSTDPPSSDLNMEGILDDAPDSGSEFNFELSDIMSYRYMDVNTPSSSLSPASSSCLPSPADSFPIDSPSPPPTTADFSEFFQASAKDFSQDFSNLTLSDQEQRELYEAAKMIQKAYRLYQGRKKQQAEQDRERQAAILIQNYYRRYKQYAYFRQMSRAATLIQTQFRSYCESKRFKKSQKEAKFCLRSSREGTPVPNLKRSYSQRRQHQAARKIQQFMRQTKQNSIWDLLTDKPIAERTSAGSRKREPTQIGGSNFRTCREASSILVHTSIGGTKSPIPSSKPSSNVGAGGPLIGALPQGRQPFAFDHNLSTSPT